VTRALFNLQQRFRAGVRCRIFRRRTVIQRAHVAVEHGIVGKLAPIDWLEFAFTPALFGCAHPFFSVVAVGGAGFS